MKKGRWVFIMLGRVPEWYFTLVACHKFSAVIMPAPVILTVGGIEYRLAKGQAAAVIRSFAEVLR